MNWVQVRLRNCNLLQLRPNIHPNYTGWIQNETEMIMPGTCWRVHIQWYLSNGMWNWWELLHISNIGHETFSMFPVEKVHILFHYFGLFTWQLVTPDM